MAFNLPLTFYAGFQAEAMIRFVLFDVDDTLYPRSSPVWPTLRGRILAYVEGVNGKCYLTKNSLVTNNRKWRKI